MKTTALLLLCFVFTANFCSGQNLVPNPSFEEYDTCPDTWSRVYYAVGWNNAGNSPDYFHTCSFQDAISPPLTGFGYQFPHTGAAYTGLSTYDRDLLNYRETIQTTLLSPLQAGVTYFFALYVNMGGMYTLGANKLGVLFSNINYSISTPAPVANFAHYYNTSIITDTSNWVKVSGSFVADSSYQFMSIGNFFDDSNTDTMGIGSVNIDAYYFIDDVCVSTDSIYVAEWDGIQTSIPNRIDDLFSAYPNPASDELRIQSYNTSTNWVLVNEFNQVITQGKHSKDFSIPVSNLSEGIYYIMFLDQGIKYSQKLVIIH
jgi:hypothetical protein